MFLTLKKVILSPNDLEQTHSYVFFVCNLIIMLKHCFCLSSNLLFAIFNYNVIYLSSCFFKYERTEFVSVSVFLSWS